MCKGVIMRVRDDQGNKIEKQVKIQGYEHIRGLIRHQFTFSVRDMLGTPKIGVNKCQVPTVSAVYVQNLPLLLLIYFLIIDLK